MLVQWARGVYFRFAISVRNPYFYIFFPRSPCFFFFSCPIARLEGLDRGGGGGGGGLAVSCHHLYYRTIICFALVRPGPPHPRAGAGVATRSFSTVAEDKLPDINSPAPPVLPSFSLIRSYRVSNINVAVGENRAPGDGRNKARRSAAAAAAAQRQIYHHHHRHRQY